MTSAPNSSPFNPSPLPSKPFSRKPHSSFTVLNSTSSKPPPRNIGPVQNIGSLQPPWLVPPPPYTPPRSDGLVFKQQLNKSAGIPFSLRLVQLKKKHEKLALTAVQPADLGSAGNAVWTLACLLENLQSSTLSIDRKKQLPLRVSRDNRYSLVWLFQRVFSSTPELALGVIVMTTDFMVKSVDALVCSIASMILEPEKVSEEEEYKRTIMAYEHMIVTEKKNSMILSNYAQLLYEYEKDINRAGDNFLCAVQAEPADPHAMSRYAMFLWQARGDIEGAEEMFNGAVEADPKNKYHKCNYFQFLDKTDHGDICSHLLEECVIDDEDGKDEQVSSF